jgi:hypothetical protein
VSPESLARLPADTFLYRIQGSYYDMLCKNSTVTPFYPIEMCAELVYTAPECEKRVIESCGRNYNKFDCRAAFDYCQTELYVPFYTTSECCLYHVICLTIVADRNWYDISQSCDGDFQECYPEVGQVRIYVD